MVFGERVTFVDDHRWARALSSPFLAPTLSRSQSGCTPAGLPAKIEPQRFLKEVVPILDAGDVSRWSFAGTGARRPQWSRAHTGNRLSAEFREPFVISSRLRQSRNGNVSGLEQTDENCARQNAICRRPRNVMSAAPITQDRLDHVQLFGAKRPIQLKCHTIFLAIRTDAMTYLCASVRFSSSNKLGKAHKNLNRRDRRVSRARVARGPRRMPAERRIVQTRGHCFETRRHQTRDFDHEFSCYNLGRPASSALAFCTQRPVS